MQHPPDLIHQPPQLRPPGVTESRAIQQEQQHQHQHQHQRQHQHHDQQVQPSQQSPSQPGIPPVQQPRPMQQPLQQRTQQHRPLLQTMPSKQQERPPAQQAAQSLRPVGKLAEAAATAVKRVPKKRKELDDPLAKAVNPFPESQLFQRLVAAERDADALLADRRAEAAACLAPPATATKKLRVYIFATHTNQAPTAGAASSAPAASPATATAPPPGLGGQGRQGRWGPGAVPAGPPSWALHVHGRLLETSGEAPPEGALPALQPFSHYLRTLSIRLSPAPAAVKRVAPARKPVSAAPRAFGSKPKPLAALARPRATPPAGAAQAVGSAAHDAKGGSAAPREGDGGSAGAADGNTVTWSAAQHVGPHRDAFQVRRVGTADMKATVTLEVDCRPHRFLCSPQLMAVAGLAAGTRPRVLQAVCAHIAAHNLEVGGWVSCDARLRAVVGADRVATAEVAALVAPHLTPAPPVTMTYTVRPTAPPPSVPDCYDVDVEVAVHTQQPASSAVAPLLQKLTRQQEFGEAAAKVDAAVQRAKEHLRRRALLLGFSRDPTQFINDLVATQARDLRQLQTEARGPWSAGTLYAPTRTELFHGRWVEDACLKCMRGN